MKHSNWVYNWLNRNHPRIRGSCSLCGGSSEDGLDLCRPCQHELPDNPTPCRGCARPLTGQSGGLCGRCLQRPPPYAAHAPFLYAQPLDRLVIDLKFNGRLHLGRTLGELLADALSQAHCPRPDVLIPVPLHPARLRERGYNQALELARPLTRRLGVPLWSQAVRRTRATPGQSGLSAQARRRNVRGSFAARERFDRMRVAVVDDVLTTGATATELAKCLHRAGALSVYVWALARTDESR